MTKHTDHWGYVRLCSPQFKNGWKTEHRYIMEKHLGHALETNMIVHHIDGNKTNNSVDNLMIMSFADHARFHRKMEKTQWSRKFQKCQQCGSTKIKHFGHGLCKHCYDNSYKVAIRLKAGHVPMSILKSHWGYSRKSKQFFDYCMNCHSTNRPYLANGLCTLCNERQRPKRGRKRF